MSGLRIKEISFAVAFVAVNTAAFWMWNRVVLLIATEAYENYLELFLAILTLACAASLYALMASVVADSRIVYTAVVSGIAIPFLFLVSQPQEYIVMLFAIGLASLGVRNMRRETFLSFSFSVSRVLHQGVPLFFTACALAFTFFYYANIQYREDVSTILPRSVFYISLGVLAQPLRSFVGDLPLDPDTTIDEFLRKLVARELEKQNINIATVPQKELTRLFSAQRADISKSYGIKLAGNEKIGDIFYEATVQRIEDLLGPYRGYVPYVSASAFFLAFKTISIVISFITLGLVWLLIKLLLAVKIVVNVKKTREVETLTLG